MLLEHPIPWHWRHAGEHTRLCLRQLHLTTCHHHHRRRAVASDDTEELVWCWRKECHNRDDVLVLCHPPPICLLHIAPNQPLLYLQVYSYIVVSRCCRGRGQSLRTDMHLLSSYFVAKLCIAQTIKIVSFLPIIQTHWCRFSCVYDVVNCCVLLAELFSLISEQRTGGESLQRQSFSETV